MLMKISLVLDLLLKSSWIRGRCFSHVVFVSFTPSLTRLVGGRSFCTSPSPSPPLLPPPPPPLPFPPSLPSQKTLVCGDTRHVCGDAGLFYGEAGLSCGDTGLLHATVEINTAS